MKKILILLSALFVFNIPTYAYVTLAPTSHVLNVGEQLFLSTPNATHGYIDHAVWACSNANISFVQKDAAGAIIVSNNYFSGTAIVELVCVEKYADEKGFTRAITYYKEYKITCSGTSQGGTEATSLSFPTQNLKIGDMVIVEPVVKPSGADVTYYSYSLTDGYADVATIFVNGLNQVEVIARAPGTEKAKITTTNGLSATITVNVATPSMPSNIVGPDGKALNDPQLFDCVRKMESLFNKSLEFKNK